MNTKQTISKRVICAVIATGLMSFCGVIVETAMNVSFPTLMQEFNVNTATVQWMTTIYLLVVAIMVPLSAILKRSFKTKQLFLSANLLFITGTILDSFAPAFPLLLLGRLVQGLGTGIALPLMFNIILEQVPLAKIGMMMGIGTLITAIAPAIGPTFGGLVATNLGWRYIFILLLPILLVSLVLGLLTIQQKNELQSFKLDLISLIFIILLFAGSIIGFSNMANFDLTIAGAFLMGIIGLVGLIIRSNHTSNPIIDLHTFKNKSFSGHAVSFFIFQLISLGLSFIVPNYIQLVNDNTATVAGLIVLPGALLGAIFAPFSGRILDHFGPRLPILLGSAFTLISLICFSLFSMHLFNWLILIIYVLLMAGAGLSFGNIMTNGLKQLQNKQQSDGNAILNTLQQFAGAVGTSIVAAIISHSQAVSHRSFATATALGSQHAFIFLLILSIIEISILIIVLNKYQSSH
ncbi:DHA2 family efflux MFS transporter permease subunit [Paucilactobacillus kaifaensis]|uniref:DHA2 family efflux MFS transporter permease subunit n=1 Tax=Paucilactobacillus kaifaensis TaxID=2559921 RepID=UPI0010F4D1D9|nr:DHA2 family efflux MFS transporter permease subunit [Paucilactobacillus kaifaensis]